MRGDLYKSDEVDMRLRVQRKLKERLLALCNDEKVEIEELFARALAVYELVANATRSDGSVQVWIMRHGSPAYEVAVRPREGEPEPQNQE